MKKKKQSRRFQQRPPLSRLRPKGKGMTYTTLKRIHLTGGGWAA